MPDSNMASNNAKNQSKQSMLALSGELSHSGVIEERKRLEAEIQGQAVDAIAVDLSELRTFNSEVLSLCLCLIRKAQTSGAELRFENTPRKLFDMARVGGIEFIFSA